jgi:flagellin-like hook-associated protein FlgL
MYTSPLLTNLAAAVRKVEMDIASVQKQLSTGTKVLNPGENGIVTTLTAQAQGYDIAVKNITSATNVLDIGQTTLTAIAEVISNMKNLASQASSAGLSTSDLASISTTFQNLFAQITPLFTAAQINGASNNILIAGSFGVTTDAAGTQFTLTGVDLGTSLGLATTSAAITTAAPFTATTAATVVTELATFLGNISTAQGTISAYSSTLDALSESAKGVSSGLTSTVGSISKIDSTLLQAQLQQLNTQQSIDYYLVSQANTSLAAILQIFR